MNWLLVLLAVTGCAKAARENAIIGGISDGGPGRRGDAGDFPEPDASGIDAPADEVTLSQTTSGVITDGNSFSCRDKITGFSTINSYYRVFKLSDFGITTTLQVTKIAFGIQHAKGGGGSQRAQVQLGTYGTEPDPIMLDPGQIAIISSADVQIPDGDGLQMAAPITGSIDPASRLIAILNIPDGSATKSTFVIGSNAEGERGVGYSSAPDCGYSDPTAMLVIGSDINNVGEADVLLTVTGTH